MQVDLNEKKLFCDVIKHIISENNNLKIDRSDFPKLALLDLESGLQIARKAKIVLENDPAVLLINTKNRDTDFVIVGDIHGNLDSLVRIFKEKGYPPFTKYLFLGDYVDRGKYSCEVMILLYALKCLFPKDIYMIRGNHEFADMTDFYGFKLECENRIDNTSTGESPSPAFTFYHLILESFTMLPVCAIINDSIFCVHGGITPLIKNRTELLKLKKVGDTYTQDDLAQEEMFWNDPDKTISTYKFSSRGRGLVFGEEATNTFLKDLHFKLIIRGHQDAKKGYDWPFGPDGGVLTVFSVIDYLKTRNNGGIAIVNNDSDSKHHLVDIQTFKKYAKFDAPNHIFTYPLKRKSKLLN